MAPNECHMLPETILGETPEMRLRRSHRRRFARSFFREKLAPRISREPLDLES